MKKIVFMALFLAAILITPVLAQSDTGITVEAHIASLRAQIAKLTTELNQLVSQQRTNLCFNFGQNFQGEDSKHPDWSKMAQVLKIEGVSSVKELQEKYTDDILRPSGLRLGTGYVGSSTRAFLNRVYKCPVTNNQAPVISGISGPTSLKVGETGTWTVKASDPNNGALNYSVIWGDETQPSASVSGLALPTTHVQQSVTFTHSYNRSGTFSPQFTVSNAAGKSSGSSVTVNVSQSSQLPITVTSPNGGKIWTTYEEKDIKWNWVNAKPTDKVDLYLDRAYTNTSICNGNVCSGSLIDIPPYTLDKNISARATYRWIVGTDIDNKLIPAGQYKVRVCNNNTTIMGVCDSSDNYFTIAAPARLMQVCPQTKVINKMPVVGGIETTPSKYFTSSTYFIMNGARWELEHFDLDWVTRNCSVKEKTVY